MRDLKVHKFLGNLRRKFLEHRERLKQMANRDENEKYLTISNNERLVGDV